MVQVGNNLAESWYNPELTASSFSLGVCKTWKGRVDESSWWGSSREAPWSESKGRQVSTAMESLHTYLRQWLGSTPGLTCIASSMTLPTNADKSQAVCGARNQNQTLLIYCLPVTRYLWEKEAVKMNTAVASNKLPHVNCKPRAGTQGSKAHRRRGYSSRVAV